MQKQKAPLKQTRRAILRSLVSIEAELGAHAIGVNVGRTKRFVTLCPVRYRFGDGETREVPQGFEFDGPSVPRLFWWITGMSPADVDTTFASCIHDYGCENPQRIPRDLADAMFRVTLAGALVNGEELLAGVEPWRRNVMYMAVRTWSHKTGAVK